MARAILSFIIIWAILVYLLVPMWRWIVLLFRSEKRRFERQLTIEKEDTKTKNMEDDLNEF